MMILTRQILVRNMHPSLHVSISLYFPPPCPCYCIASDAFAHQPVGSDIGGLPISLCLLSLIPMKNQKKLIPMFRRAPTNQFLPRRRMLSSCSQIVPFTVDDSLGCVLHACGRRRAPFGKQAVRSRLFASPHLQYHTPNGELSLYMYLWYTQT